MTLHRIPRDEFMRAYGSDGFSLLFSMMTGLFSAQIIIAMSKENSWAVLASSCIAILAATGWYGRAERARKARAAIKARITKEETSRDAA